MEHLDESSSSRFNEAFLWARHGLTLHKFADEVKCSSENACRSRMVSIFSACCSIDQTMILLFTAGAGNSLPLGRKLGEFRATI